MTPAQKGGDYLLLYGNRLEGLDRQERTDF